MKLGVFFLAICAMTLFLDTNVARPPEVELRLARALMGTADLSTAARQVAFIDRVQRTVLRLAPHGAPIPEGQRRELSDLLRHGSGQCFDRSRAIETILSAYGLETRHVFALAPTGQSHALTEVRTLAGWRLVDSNTAWQGPPDGSLSAGEGPEVIRGSHVTIRGLYSRHGRFYPPYLPFPDVAWREIGYNL